MRTFVCKFIGVITCIAAGLVSSKGGPFVHLGSIVGGGLSGMGSSTLSGIFGRPIKAPRKYGGYFRNDADHRDYVSIGAAAGDLCLVNEEVFAEPHATVHYGRLIVSWNMTD